MGSFAYSLHVKCDDSDRVAGAIGQVLAREGWRAADVPPAEPAEGLGEQADRRALFVSAPVYGWVSVLDCDLAGAYALAPLLAEQLRAYTLLCLVNDSDSWSYVLYRDDGLLDEFDSEGQDAAADELSDGELAELGQTMQQLQARLADGSLQQEMLRMTQEVLAQAPAEIRELHDRIQHGRATQEDMARFRAWEQAEAPQHAEKIGQVVGQLLGVPALSKAAQGAKRGKSQKSKRKSTKAERAAAQQRADNLRPLFVAGTSDEQFQEVTREKAVFAEQTLAKFLPLVGIPAHYAYLSYDYHAETTPEELSTHGIRFETNLIFESAS